MLLRTINIFFLLISVILAGCGVNSSVDIEEIEDRVSDIKDFAESGFVDIEGFRDAIDDFDIFLKGIDDENLSKYIDAQLKANEKRRIGLKEMDGELITESSLLQAQALQILEDVKQ